MIAQHIKWRLKQIENRLNVSSVYYIYVRPVTRAPDLILNSDSTDDNKHFIPSSYEQNIGHKRIPNKRLISYFFSLSEHRMSQNGFTTIIRENLKYYMKRIHETEAKVFFDENSEHFFNCFVEKK